MTRRIDLFIASDLPLGELAVAVAERTGLEVVPGPAGDTVSLRRGDVVVELGEHHRADGDELRLSRYRYVLSGTTDAAGHLGDVPETQLLRRSAGQLADGFDVLLVLDLQFRDPQPAA
ncbi:hypothetical protein GHK86_09910 [Acidimicrobiaceae bacterium USS-CC1]|uniref:Uncharacterized protein n=1 Tax=Acidiferrimicrobium australe TaxID=2664430 RepID=A0ABW9QT61_9ACTN|nr:hypothetical protein [Acidiferrimicrobium australe]